MDRQVNFKSAINGYDKTAVLQHIDQLNQEYTEMEKVYKLQLDQCNAVKSSLEGEIASLKEEAEGLRQELCKQKELYMEQLDEQKRLYAERLRESEKLQEQLSYQKKTAEDMHRELLAQQEQNRIIQSKVDSVEYKSKKYDEAASSIGGMILEARQGVNRILEDAQKQAKGIEERANQEAYRILCDAQKNLLETNQRTQMLKAEFFDLRDQLNGTVALINSHFDSLGKEIEEKEIHLQAMMEEAQKAILPEQEQEQAQQGQDTFETGSEDEIDIPIKEEQNTLTEENLEQLLKIHLGEIEDPSQAALK